MITLRMEEILLKKLFIPNKWLSLWKMIKKDSKVQNDISQTTEKNNKESYPTQSKLEQNVSFQSKVFDQEIKKREKLLKIWI